METQLMTNPLKANSIVLYCLNLINVQLQYFISVILLLYHHLVQWPLLTVKN